MPRAATIGSMSPSTSPRSPPAQVTQPLEPSVELGVAVGDVVGHRRGSFALLGAAWRLRVQVNSTDRDDTPGPGRRQGGKLATISRASGSARLTCATYPAGVGTGTRRS